MNAEASMSAPFQSFASPSRRRFLIGAATAALSPAVAGAQGTSPTRLGAPLGGVEAWTQALLREHRVPGGVFAIVRDREVLSAWAQGVADVDSGAPARLDSVFCMASITKTVSALLCQRLSEAGLLDLDLDLGDYAGYAVRNPAFPDVPITLRHVLTHESSMLDGDYSLYDPTYTRGVPPDPASATAYAHLLYGPGSSHSLESGYWGPYAPGAATNYTNSHFAFVSIAVLAATGRSDVDWLDNELFPALGLEMRWDPTSFPRDRFMTPYGWRQDGVDDERGLPVNPRVTVDRRWDQPGYTGFVAYDPIYSYAPYADGITRTDIRSLARLCLLYINGGALDGVAAVSPEGMADMMTVRGHHHDGGSGQGLGLGTATYGFQRTAWLHGGGEYGSRSILCFDPERRIGVVGNVNLDVIDMEEVGLELLVRVLEHLGEPR